MPYIYWDSTYILVVIGAVICMIASARVKTTFNKYSAYRSMSGMTGAQAAERILHAAGIYDVRVQHVSGNLTDHYNPANKTLNLSDSVCNQTSVAAVKNFSCVMEFLISQDSLFPQLNHRTTRSIKLNRKRNQLE